MCFLQTVIHIKLFKRIFRYHVEASSSHHHDHLDLHHLQKPLICFYFSHCLKLSRHFWGLDFIINWKKMISLHNVINIFIYLQLYPLFKYFLFRTGLLHNVEDLEDLEKSRNFIFDQKVRQIQHFIQSCGSQRIEKF